MMRAKRGGMWAEKEEKARPAAAPYPDPLESRGRREWAWIEAGRSFVCTEVFEPIQFEGWANGRIGQERADLRGGQFGKAGRPIGTEARKLAGGDGKKKFEVLAIAKGMPEGECRFAGGGGDGDGGKIDFGAAAGGVEKAGEVGGDAVGKVHGGGGEFVGGEELAGLEAWLEEKMAAGAWKIGAAKGAGDKQEVAWPAAGPEQGGSRGTWPTQVTWSSRDEPSAVSPPRIERFHLRAAAIRPT